MTDVRKTPADAIGHVAPDFSDRRQVNTLRIRPQFRISLCLGSIDELCPDPPDTMRGRQVRLQLLGYLYEPLSSPAVGAAFQAVWRWFESELLKGDQQIAEELAQIVEGNRLPVPGECVRVMLPGSYCYSEADEHVALAGMGVWPSPPKRSYHYVREQSVWDANPVLGVIPIIAKVEQYSAATDRWQPAPGVLVYLQLQPPDAPTGAAMAPSARDTATIAPPEVIASPGPAGYVRRFTSDPDHKTPIDPADPQVDNCHSVAGGKRGVRAAGHVLELTLPDGSLRTGFYRAHRARETPGHPPWYPPPEAAPATTPHAIRASTNGNGEAGFVFKPSRAGGDRYKLRAFVGSPLASDGTAPDAVAVETGTFVVWRRIRIAKYLVWDYPDEFVEPPEPPATVRTALELTHFRVRQMGPINLANVASEFAKAYCDVVVEATAARRALTGAEWTQARDHALAHMPRTPHLKMSAVIPNINTTPCVVPTSSRSDYNAAIAGSKEFPQLQGDASYWRAMKDVTHNFLEWFIDYFTRAALPFVIIQAPYGDWLSYSATIPATLHTFTTSGRSSNKRGAHLWWGMPFYDEFSYNIDHNTVHEMAHCHYGTHSWTESQASPPLSGGFSTQHDEHDRCVMGYLPMPGDFCGKCLLRLRGWDIAALWVDFQYLVQLG